MKCLYRCGIFFLILLCLTILPAQSWAVTCSASASATNFGNYNPLTGGNSDSTGNVGVSCAPSVLELVLGYTVNYLIELSTGGGGTYTQREMVSATGTLFYNLFTNASRTLIWGDGSGGTSTVNDGYTSNATVDRNYTVYGRIPGAQNVPSGSYSDTIIVTVTY